MAVEGMHQYKSFAAKDHKELEHDDGISRCSTCPPSPASPEVSPAVSWPRLDAQEAARAPEGYIVCDEVLGAGTKGIVHKGIDAASGRKVAVKRVHCDADCPVRFLSLQGSDRREVLSAEGFASQGGSAAPWTGTLAYVPSNSFGAVPFQPNGPVQGCVVLVRRGGGVSFAEKVSNAQCGGATGVLIVNHEDELEAYSLGARAGHSEARLPSMMLGRTDGEAAIEFITANQRAYVEVCTDVGHETSVSRRLLPHPNVIQIYDAWEEQGGGAVIVMELCSGGKVSMPFGPRGSCSLSMALWLIKQMLCGLAHLHAQGVCHRDLKPENMLLTRTLGDTATRLVLVDFSMASTARRMSIPCGSPRYLAPEVLSGKYGRQRDVWSAGMVAHELIFRWHPWRNLSDTEVLARLVDGPAPCVEAAVEQWGRAGFGGEVLEQVPESVCDLLRGLLCRDPDARLTPVQALAHPSLQLVADSCPELMTDV